MLNMDAVNANVRKDYHYVHEQASYLPIIPAPPVREPITQEELNIGENQSETMRSELVAVVNDYRECVGKNLFELGFASDLERDIRELPESRPVMCKPYRVRDKDRDIIRRTVSEWRGASIVSDMDSPYASPMLLVR